jgi:hypothetical protein
MTPPESWYSSIIKLGVQIPLVIRCIIHLYHQWIYRYRCNAKQMSVFIQNFRRPVCQNPFLNLLFFTNFILNVFITEPMHWAWRGGSG